VYDETLTIRIHGADGSIWPVHGKSAGERGVWMAQDQVEGLFETFVRQSWDSGAQQVGGNQRGVWFDARDLLLGFHVTDNLRSEATTLAAFRQAFVYRVDRWDHNAVQPKIEVESDISGSRFLDVLLYDKPDFNPGTDPLVVGYGNPILPLRAGQPFWYSDDEVSTFTSGSASASGFVTVSNPCDVDTGMFHKWEVTRCQATLPDFSWEGAPGARVPGVDFRSKRDDSARTILLPLINATHGTAKVDLEFLIGNALPIRDASDQNMVGQLPVPGKYFMYEIPPHTPPYELPVSYTGAPAGGAMIRLIMPRRWMLPFGGEWMGGI
jgi:hypothetical protein